MNNTEQRIAKARFHIHSIAGQPAISRVWAPGQYLTRREIQNNLSVHDWWQKVAKATCLCRDNESYFKAPSISPQNFKTYDALACVCQSLYRPSLAAALCAACPRWRGTQQFPVSEGTRHSVAQHNRAWTERRVCQQNWGLWMLFAQCSIRIFVFQTALSISYIGVVKQRKIRDPPPRGIVKSELVEIPKNNIDSVGCWTHSKWRQMKRTWTPRR